jgi:FkbM family methyltransferase
MSIVDTRYGKFNVIDNDNVISHSVRVYGEWAQKKIDFLAHFIKPANFVIDAGAFIGTHSIAFSSMVGELGKVLAFEPRKNIAEILGKNSSISTYKNIEVMKFALGSKSGIAKINLSPTSEQRNFGAMSLTESLIDDDAFEEVKLITIDSLNLEKIDFIKVDVEGMESEVVNGAKKTIGKNRPFIFIECNSIDSVEPFMKWCKKEMYKIYGVISDAFNPNNFLANPVNYFDIAREVGLFLLPNENVNEHKKYLKSQNVPEILTLDDISLLLLHKPQYPFEVLNKSPLGKLLTINFPSPLSALYKNEITNYKNEITNYKNEITNYKNEITNYKNEITNYKNEITNYKNEITNYKNEISSVKAILEKVYQSRSWRITQPLRNIILFRNKLYKLVNLYGIFKLKNPGFKGIIRLYILFLKFITSGGFENFKNRVSIYSEAQSSNRKLTNFWPNRKILMVDDSESNLIHDGDDIAVHLHAYYEEMSDEIIEYLNQIPFKFHLYITTDKKKKLTALKDKFLNLKNLKSSKFLLTPNKGRDIAPMIVSLGKELIEHDIVLHIHTKKSPHNIKLRGWRRYLLTSLLGNSYRIRSILNEFYKDVNLGILFPVPFNPIRPCMHVGGNYLNMKNLLKREGKNINIKSVSMDYFPGGSMFWFRGKAIKSLVDIGLLYADFEEEKGQTDTTLAHAIERLFVSFAESSSLSSKAYSTYEFDPDSGISNIEWLNFYISKKTIFNPVLIFDHDYGGGTNSYSNILVNKIIDKGNQVIRVRFKNDLWFLEWFKASDALVFATNKMSEFFGAISKANPSKIVINSLYGYFDVDKVIVEIIKLRKLYSIQLEIKAHDFYALCPSPHLLNFNNKYCAVPLDQSICDKCLEKNVAWHIPGCWPENISRWRSSFSELLIEATKIDFFHSSTVDIYKKIFVFTDEKISITPHDDDYFNVTLYPKLSGKLHLGLLGTLTIVKGGAIVNELSSYIKIKRLDIPITLIGSSMLPLDQDITVTGNYEISNLPRLISEYKINVVFISSIVPETFSFTTSEAIKMKLPIICFDLGSQGSRVKNYDLGQVMPLNSTSKEILMAAQALLKKAQNKI